MRLVLTDLYRACWTDMIHDEWTRHVLKLPDVDDRHGVAAAIHGGASLIVTFNLKDFPPEQLKRYNLAAQHPNDFIFDAPGNRLKVRQDRKRRLYRSTG